MELILALAEKVPKRSHPLHECYKSDCSFLGPAITYLYMSVTGVHSRNMQHLSTAFLIIALVIVVNQGTGAASGVENNAKHDQLAEEARNSALTITDGPKYVNKQSTARNNTNETWPSTEAQSHNHKPEQRPPSKPPINLDKVQQRPQKYYVELPRNHYGPLQKVSVRHFPQSPLMYHPPNNLYNNYQQVIPLTPHKNSYYIKQQSRPLAFASSVNAPTVAQSPKFSLPVQTINGVRSDTVRPPQNLYKTNVSTTTVPTTTTRLLRTKRIWPKKILEKMNATLKNSTKKNDTHVIDNRINDSDPDTAETVRVKYVYKNANTTETPIKRPYRPVTRIPKIKSTTPSFNVSEIQPNDWIPLMPSHYTRPGRPTLKRIKRSDTFPGIPEPYPRPTVPSKRMLYLHSFGLIPMNNLQTPMPEIARKKASYFRKRKRQLNPYYSGYSTKPGIGVQHYYYDDHHGESSHIHSHGHSYNNHQHEHQPKVVTRVKHHHHHHHHRYIKTVEKPVKVPYKVEVPKPYPVAIPVEKRVPVTVEKVKVVEKPVPYPIGIKVPHPVPVKVVEKEYIPKPYAVIQQVPVVKHVKVKVPHPVPVQVEKRVPYPVEVQVPVDRPVPVPVEVEKQVPYPVPVKVLVPQPYPVETKVPYPVQVKVKEPFEVIKHVPVRVPVPQPFAVPHPVPVHVEKKVPYPVEVEKKVPVPFKVIVPQKVEVEKKVPVYIPKPYPVEKKVPVPVKVPYPVRVPVKVPYEVPVYLNNPGPIYGDGYYVSGGINVSEESATQDPNHTVTVHGNTGFTGFQSRSDGTETTTASTTSNP